MMNNNLTTAFEFEMAVRVGARLEKTIGINTTYLKKDSIDNKFLVCKKTNTQYVESTVLYYGDNLSEALIAFNKN